MNIFGTLLKRFGLSAIVFFTGGAILVVEILAIRSLAPYFGSTIYASSSVITVILAGLSLGYALGGRYSDRFCQLKDFAWFVIAGGFGILLVSFCLARLMPALGYQFSLLTGPLLVSLILFFVPTVFLGMLSPFAIALQHQYTPNAGHGKVAGNIFFWSTLGSIAGSLLTAFYFIPTFPLSVVWSGVGFSLVLCGALCRVAAGTSMVEHFPILLLSAGIAALSEMPGHPLNPVYLSDGLYQQIMIVDRPIEGRMARAMLLDRGGTGVMFEETKQSANAYVRSVEWYPSFSPSVENALILGGGAYLIPKRLHELDPNMSIHVAEIEPSLEALSHEWFSLPKTPQIKTILEDARHFMVDNQTQYDLIFSDVFQGMHSCPQQMLTHEFFKLSHEHLTDNGVFFANIIGASSSENLPSIFGSAYRTFTSVFKHSIILAMDSAENPQIQNFLMVGKKTPLGALPESIARRAITLDANRLSKEILLTDDYAPTEYLTAKLLTMA